MSDEIDVQPPADDSWKAARKLASVILPIPSLFSTAVRSINRVADEARGLDQMTIRGAASAKASFLVGVSPTLKTVLYNAAKAIHPDALLKLDPLNHRGLMLTFAAEELAAVLALTYLRKKVGKLCDPEEWPRISAPMQIHMRVGQIIGETIEHIGTGNGLLIGGVRFISTALFAIDDLKSFQKYRRRCEKEGKLFDVREEQELWGCNHMQVASLLVQAIGFGMPRHPAALCFGLDSLEVKVETLPGSMQEQVLCWQAAFACTESYHTKNQAPSLTNQDGTMFLPPEEAEALGRRVQIAKSSPAADWLSAKAEELPPEVAERLGIHFKKHESEEERAVFDEDDGAGS